MTDTPITKPHHQVEDIPPDDVDTQLALFEQSTDVVKGSAEAAEWLLKNAELVLGHVFQTAEKAKDTELAERVQDVWSGVQTVTDFISRQGAVIAGSKEALAALKAQRDKVFEELKGIREALNGYDTDHPELADYAETLQEMWEEYSWMYDDTSYDIAFDNIRDEFLSTFRRYAHVPERIAEKIFDLLIHTPGLLTGEQKDLLKKLALTIEDAGDSVPLVLGEEDEDEDGDE